MIPAEASPGSSGTPRASRSALEALGVWMLFLLACVLINASIPFALGADVSAWTGSWQKSILFGAVIYGLLFLVVPVLLVKGQAMARHPVALALMLLMLLSAALWSVVPFAAFGILLGLGLMHRKYGLAELGVRFSLDRSDLLALLFIALLYSVPQLASLARGRLDLVGALAAGLKRLLANPATTAEYLFYFGFLATRLEPRLGRWVTPALIGLLYAVHEMTNPEYWAEGMQFALVGIGVAAACSIYLWRRNLLPIWLGDGLSRLLQAAAV